MTTKKLSVVETKEVTTYIKKKNKKTGETENGPPTTVGIRFLFDDVNRLLELGEPVTERSASGVDKPAKAHGTKVFYTYRFGTFSVTEPHEPMTYRSGSPLREIGKGKIVAKPGKNGRGKIDDGGMPIDKFVREYPHLAALCMRALQKEGLTLDKNQNALAKAA